MEAEESGIIKLGDARALRTIGAFAELFTRWRSHFEKDINDVIHYFQHNFDAVGIASPAQSLGRVEIALKADIAIIARVLSEEMTPQRAATLKKACNDIRGHLATVTAYIAMGDDLNVNHDDRKQSDVIYESIEQWKAMLPGRGASGGDAQALGHAIEHFIRQGAPQRGRSAGMSVVG